MNDWCKVVWCICTESETPISDVFVPCAKIYLWTHWFIMYREMVRIKEIPASNPIEISSCFYTAGTVSNKNFSKGLYVVQHFLNVLV